MMQIDLAQKVCGIACQQDIQEYEEDTDKTVIMVFSIITKKVYLFHNFF